MATIVSAHNPMTGPRHLGHYGSTMAQWNSLLQAEDDELFLIIDDLIAAILNPQQRREIQNRTMMTGAEFLAMGLPSDRCHITLTSMVPEAHELAFFAGMLLDVPWCLKLHSESFPGLLTSNQRSTLGLPRHASVTELTYPQLHLVSLMVGLGADSFQGGEEMRGYAPLLHELAPSLGATEPQFLPGPSTFVLGTDGRHMGSENAVYLSSPEDLLKRQLETVKDPAVFRSWTEAIGRPDLLPANDFAAEEVRDSTGETLLETLRPFRENDRGATNRELAEAFERGGVVARLRCRDRLKAIKAEYGIPGFVRS